MSKNFPLVRKLSLIKKTRTVPQKKLLERNTICPNCNHPLALTDNFCPQCGQANRSHNRSFWHLLLELLETTIHFDTKFWLTAKTLFLRPGIITKEYNEEKRSRYVPPLRLYVFASFVTFLLIGVTVEKHMVAEIEKSHQVLPDSVHTQHKNAGKNVQYINFSIGDKELNFNKKEGKFIEDGSPEQIDSLLKVKGMKNKGWFSRTIMRNIVKMMYSKHLQQEFVHHSFNTAAKLMFLLMPLFAFLMWLIYVRRKRNYYEFLIFSVHFHSLVFILFSILILIDWTTSLDLTIYGFLVLPFYLLFAMKNCYKQRWGKTILKWVIVNILYFVTFLCFFVMALMLSTITL